VKITFVYPSFERHADAHPQLREHVPVNEYLGPPSLGIASVAAATPLHHEIEFIDDRITPLDPDHPSDLFAFSFFTPAATRALALADELKAAGKTVVMGGIFPSQMPEEVMPHCDAVVVGEGEGVWAQLVEDAERGALKSRYDAPADLDLSSIAPPRVELYLDAETAAFRPDDYPLQLSRGCPLACDACVLPCMHGRSIRFHSDETLWQTVRVLTEHGKLISLTEDTSHFGVGGTRKRFRGFLERVIREQQEGSPVRLSYLGISMPMILSLDRSLLELLKQTGIQRFYLVGGFDPITRGAFGIGDHLALEKAERTIDRCHEFGIDPYVSFLVGNADDDEGIFDRILQFADKTRVDLAEFVVSTPYPGTPLWHRYLAQERIFDFTWKHYNDANVVFRPHKMSPERLQEGYFYLWREFYGGRRAELAKRNHERCTVQF
jgi:radical SAM superfamily enzyme YgiQ (UPF0313 family)